MYNIGLFLALGSSLAFDGVGKLALSAVVSVLVLSHKDSGSTLWLWALFLQAGNFVVLLVNLVVLEDRKLDLLSLVLVLFGLSEDLLLSLLGTSIESEHDFNQRSLLQALKRLQQLSSADESLGIDGDS